MRPSYVCLFFAALMQVVGPSRLRADEEPGLTPGKPTEGVFVETRRGYMIPYTETLPGTDVTFEMVPIPGGRFLMGSFEHEKVRSDDERPQFTVIVGPFWMGRHEVTWGEYGRFMALYEVGKRMQAAGVRVVGDGNRADAVTIPTPLYNASQTYERGQRDDEPAVTMTPYAARQYTKWLSLQLGRFYRLPSEAEWEYACRAGAPTAYGFGDDAGELGDFAWYFDNSMKEAIGMEAYHAVGSKRPNAWGLYDMHGNVSELVLDEYRADHYATFRGGMVTAHQAIAWPTKRGPRVHRGGSWDSDADRVRSAARGRTDEKEWRLNDPNTPKSPWWYTTVEARSVGMRVLRPLMPPATREERERYWEEDVQDIRDDTETRLGQLKALLIPIDPGLKDDIRNAAE